MSNIYLQLTREFNSGRLRAILGGGQAVVLHRLAIMSKDADWILREDKETMSYVLSVLEKYDAHYRFGAPLDIRWLQYGWSAHLEFTFGRMRIRTDFVTKPPRIDAQNLKRIWAEQEGRDIPFLDANDLAKSKQTNREKDYVVIGELARKMSNVDDEILYSRSARDLIQIASQHPLRVRALTQRRPILLEVSKGLEALEAALDLERRRLIHSNEERLEKYISAAEPWAKIWHSVASQTEGLKLSESHNIVVNIAEGVLPYEVTEGWT